MMMCGWGSGWVDTRYSNAHCCVESLDVFKEIREVDCYMYSLATLYFILCIICYEANH